MKIIKVIILIAAFILFLYYENEAIGVTNIKLEFDNLPYAFNGYKILHLSDLHGKVFGKDNSILVSMIKKAKPDLIVITGDLIDSERYDEGNILEFISKIKNEAPIYYVTGNHETAEAEFPVLEQKLRGEGINILRNAADIIERNGDNILLAGVDDPTLVWNNDYNRKVLAKQLKMIPLINEKGSFKILLSHRPEQFSLYTEYNIDLVFAGHAHGGQVRLPFLGGLVAPNQGIFPKYTSGKYVSENTTMVVSRGLGNGTISQRLFNRPEIVVATLYKG